MKKGFISILLSLVFVVIIVGITLGFIYKNESRAFFKNLTKPNLTNKLRSSSSTRTKLPTTSKQSTQSKLKTTRSTKPKAPIVSKTTSTSPKTSTTTSTNKIATSLPDSQKTLPDESPPSVISPLPQEETPVQAPDVRDESHVQELSDVSDRSDDQRLSDEKQVSDVQNQSHEQDRSDKEDRSDEEDRSQVKDQSDVSRVSHVSGSIVQNKDRETQKTVTQEPPKTISPSPAKTISPSPAKTESRVERESDLRKKAVPEKQTKPSQPVRKPVSNTVKCHSDIIVYTVTDYIAKANDTTKFDVKITHGGFYDYIFKPGSKCIQVLYKNVKFWQHNHEHGNNYPKEIIYVPTYGLVYIYMNDTWYYKYSYLNGGWNLIDSNLSGRPIPLVHEPERPLRYVR